MEEIGSRSYRTGESFLMALQLYYRVWGAHPSIGVELELELFFFFPKARHLFSISFYSVCEVQWITLARRFRFL